MTAVNLQSDHFNVEVCPTRGTITRLSYPQDALNTNFTLSPSSAPEFDVADSRWLGDVLLSVKQQSPDARAQYLSTGLSRSKSHIYNRSNAIHVDYPALSGTQGSAVPIALHIKYALNGLGDELRMEIETVNTGDVACEIEDLGLPFTMNSLWQDTQEKIYDQNVLRHSFIAQHGSVLYWQKPSGEGPFLVMVPCDDTRLEYSNKIRSGEGVLGETGAKWEGMTEYYVHSKAVSLRRAEFGSNAFAPSSCTLGAGDSVRYAFTFKWAVDFGNMRQTVYDLGGLDVISLPGYVIPEDTTILLALRSSSGIDAIEGNASIRHLRNVNGYELHEVRIDRLGETTLTVRYARNRQSVLRYYRVDSIERLINSRARFIATKQQALTSHSYNGAFLQWDMTTRSLLTWHNYPGGGWKEWMVGGSDDLGLAPAVFLARKNQHFPVCAEIQAVDRYLEDFILGFLQNARDENGERTFQVYRWYDGQDREPEDKGVWRAYNYTHIANTYFSMFEIARHYPSCKTRLQPLQYLTYAYQTLLAMFTKIPQPTPIGDAASDLGLMGESSIPEILDALLDNGFNQEWETINGFLQHKYHRFSREKYPFASEQTIDTTGFETSYTLAHRFGDQKLASKVQAASMACRGMQPNWYHYGSDNRHMGETWWNLGYETQLGAWQQFEYLLHDNVHRSEAPETAEMMRSTYGAYFGGWALINSGQIDSHDENIGAAAWLYQSEKGKCEWSHMPISDGWWMWSGEADLGFWGALKTAATCVVDDPVAGLYAYGGQLRKANSRLEVIPQDGLRVRVVFMFLDRLSFSVKRARFVKVTLADDGTIVDLEIEFPQLGEKSAHVTVMNTCSKRWRLIGQNHVDDWNEVRQGSLQLDVESSKYICHVRIELQL